MFFSIPRAASSSSHYVDKVGGYHKILIWTLSPIISDPKLKFQLTMLAGIRNMTKFPDAAASFWVGIKKCDALGSIQAKQISPRLCHPAFEMSTTVRKPKTTGQHVSQ